MAKHTYWVRWEADDNIPDKDIAATWPTGMKGWVSGYGGSDEASFRVWCARVDADTPAEAEKIVRSMYGKHGAKIRLSWDPAEHEHELGWRNNSGRFPE
jgi:hypothetical protein